MRILLGPHFEELYSSSPDDEFEISSRERELLTQNEQLAAELAEARLEIIRLTSRRLKK
jgi:hypothetical protein